MSKISNFFPTFPSNRELTKILLFSLFALCIVGVSIMFFSLSIGKPYMGIVLAKSDQGWVVKSVDTNGLASKEGIRLGDKPIEINGQSSLIFLKKYEEPGAVWSMLIHELVVIDDNGQLKSATIEDGSLSWESIIEQGTWLVISLMFWVTGFYVFIKRRGNIAALLLCMFGLMIGLALSANMAAAIGVTTALQFHVAATIIGPWLLLHFFLILPEERAWLVNKPLIYLIYLPALVTLIIFLLIGHEEGQPVQWFQTIRLFEYGVVFLAVVSVAIFNYVQSSTARTRQQMKLMLFTSLAALVPIVVLNILPMAFFRQTILPPGISILFVVFIPIGMGYAVITRKLMNIDIIIRRGVVYSLITIVLAAIFSTIIFITFTIQGFPRVTQAVLIALVLSIIAIALFGPIKRMVENLIDRLVYKDRYDYRQIIQSLSIALNSVKDSNDVSRLVVGTIVRTLNLSGGCLFIKNQSGSLEISAAQGIYTNKVKQKKLLSTISQHDKLIEFPNSVSSVDQDLAFIVPLIAVDKEVGILCLSQKVTRQDFSSGDIYLLQGVISVASVALHSSMLIRDVSIRDTFVSIASHELRTPMTAIMGYTELLLRRNPPVNTRKQWLKNIYKNSDNLTNIIDDLLNVTRIQSGKVNMKIEKVRLQDIIEESLTFTRESSNIHDISVEIDPNLPAVNIDRVKFGQVIGNLLSNAIKYSPEGGRIMLTMWEDVKKSRVVIGISDEGIGIGPEDKDLLFTTFHRIQRPETRSIKGSGLGLYIAKEWIEEMGGNIWLESKLNEGSTFFISIPVSK